MTPNGRAPAGALEGNWLEFLAPAKVNPWLYVGKRRPDGYHEVDLGLLALDLCDRVAVRLSGSAAGASARIVLEVSGPCAGDDVPRDGQNLAWRGAEAVVEEAVASGALHAAPALELRLAKHVPSGSGLGGGSSDAAAAALATCAILGIELPRERLLTRLAALGSDCAFFVAAAASGYARAKGHGERIEVLPAVSAAWHVALVIPAVHVSTALAYSHFPSSLRSGASVPTVPLDLFDRPLADARAALENDLEPAAQRAVPAMRRWRMLLDACGAKHFCMSGSGSSFFGLFDDEADMLRALDEVKRNARVEGLQVRCIGARPFGTGARLATTLSPG